MTLYVPLYDRVPDSSFLHHVLRLNRLSELRVGKETYGAMLGKQAPLLEAEFLPMPGQAPDSAVKMLKQGRQALLDLKTAVKDNDRLLFINMRYYPVDWAWFRHLLVRLEFTDIPLVVLHSGLAALVGVRWSAGPEEMNNPEPAVIEDTRDRLVDIGRTDNLLRLASNNFSLRYFNSLGYGRTGYFHKRSSDIRKIQAEHGFLSTLPVGVRTFFPVVGDLSEDSEGAGYEIEIIPSLDVARLLLNGRFAVPESMDRLIEALETYLEACPKRPCGSREYTMMMRALFVTKTEARLDALARLPVSATLDLTCRSHGFESLGHFAAAHLALCEESIAAETGNELVFSHGDLFFSNILFDPITEKIKLIDPKGGHDDAFLPAWYDIAKLSHSFLGRYDMLVYDEFSINMATDLSLKIHIAEMPGADGLAERFLGLLGRRKLDLRKLRLFEAALFLSMLPLHADSPLRMHGQLLQAVDIHKRLTTPEAPLSGVWTGNGRE